MGAIGYRKSYLPVDLIIIVNRQNKEKGRFKGVARFNIVKNTPEFYKSKNWHQLFVHFFGLRVLGNGCLNYLNK